MTEVALQLGLGDPVPSRQRDTYTRYGSDIVHELVLGDLDVRSVVTADGRPSGDVRGDWWRSYLDGAIPVSDERRGDIRSADLFSGPGGLALGHRQLAREMGSDVVPAIVADSDADATRVYAANHGARHRYTKSITSLLDFRIRGGPGDYRFSYRPEILDRELEEEAERCSVVLAGPPCQGHSNLNNSSRRTDPRNELYLTVPAFTVAAGVDIAIIENVPAVLNDASDVVGTARELFESEGYHVTSGLVRASDMGWPQTRRRHFMIARRDAEPWPLEEVSALLADDPRPVWWAIEDLEDLDERDPLHQVATLSEENQARVAWLHDNDEYDLALSERPESHRNGTSYTAVYGRMHQDRPAPTITGGFTSPGRGRFTHPTQRRVISAREAARLQGFPDTYNFDPDPVNPPTKQKLAKWIGDAVPMPLGYAAAVSAYAGGVPNQRP